MNTKETKRNRKVDAHIRHLEKWRDETEKLRAIILGCGLTEELKWGKPCYMFLEGNVVLIQGFKAYCALLFFKGVLLKDTHKMLVKTGANTRVGRQIRFTNVADIVKAASNLKAYIHQAVEVEKAGLKVDSEVKADLVLPVEFQKKLKEDRTLKAAFNALTPGRQRAYSFYFSAPKQSKTREARVAKCVQQILDGKGIHD